LKHNENHIEIKFFDFDIRHEEISKIIGLNPTSVWYKGEPCKFDNESIETIKHRKENFWSYGEVTETNDYIGNLVDGFIKTIVIPRIGKINRIAEKFEGEFSIVQYIYDGYNPGFYLENEQLAILNNCGLGLNVDFYVLSETEGDNA
jgi:Domain of unknown function (DUF4279)